MLKQHQLQVLMHQLSSWSAEYLGSFFAITYETTRKKVDIFMYLKISLVQSQVGIMNQL